MLSKWSAKVQSGQNSGMKFFVAGVSLDMTMVRLTHPVRACGGVEKKILSQRVFSPSCRASRRVVKDPRTTGMLTFGRETDL